MPCRCASETALRESSALMGAVATAKVTKISLIVGRRLAILCTLWVVIAQYCVWLAWARRTMPCAVDLWDRTFFSHGRAVTCRSANARPAGWRGEAVHVPPHPLALFGYSDVHERPRSLRPRATPLGETFRRWGTCTTVGVDMVCLGGYARTLDESPVRSHTSRSCCPRTPGGCWRPHWRPAVTR